MSCTECEKISQKKNLIFEDSLVSAVLSDKPAALGHIAVLPKEHQPIIEKIPDNIFAHMFSVANKISIACFDALGAHGTNILINNGVAAGQKTSHSIINIIPRNENDNINMHWQAIKPSEDDLSTVQLMIKEDLERGERKEIQKEAIKQEEIEEKEGEENYLLKQLERIP